MAPVTLRLPSTRRWLPDSVGAWKAIILRGRILLPGRSNMRAMKQRLIGTVAVLSLVLSACGGAASAPSSAPASPSPASAKPAGSTAASAKPAGSTAASAKPAASASAKPAASAVASAKPSASGAAGPQQSSQPIPSAAAGTINLALVGGSPSAAPIYIGLEEHLFEKYNAPVQVIIMTAPAAMAALIAGEVQ